MKKVLLKSMLIIAMMISLGASQVWGQTETIIYSTGFESADGFVASTVYNNPTPVFTGPAGHQWGTVYGTPSTTTPNTGLQSMQMRWYTTAPTVLGYTFTNFDMANVTKVTFNAKNTNTINVTASYSIDGGSSYVGDETFVLSTTVAPFTYNISATGQYPSVRIKFQIAYTTAPTATSRLIIDEIAVYGMSGGLQTVATPTFNPPTGTYSTPQNVVISTETPNATIYYTTDGNDPSNTSSQYFNPIPVNSTTTIKAIAYADGMNPSAIASATYTFIVVTQVATIAELRANPTGVNIYHLTGEAVMTFKQTFRNQKYIQDATAGILIDDLGGKITTVYNVGDGITGIKGTLAEFGGMLQFTPIEDPGPASSTGNTVTPQEITFAEFNTNFENYESELVKINGVTFTNAGQNFVNGMVYPMTDASAKASANFRATFFDVNYIGTQIPIYEVNVTGISNSRVEGNFLTARNLADFTPTSTEPSIIVTSPNGGELWEQGSTHNITWVSLNYSDNVKIELSGQLTPYVISASAPNTGSFSWTIPANQSTLPNYKIKISGVVGGTPVDLSDNAFHITGLLPDPEIVINEIHYNPSTAQGNDNLWEYMELYNKGDYPTDLGGWSIPGISYTIPSGTTLNAGAYVAIAVVPANITTYYGVTNVLGPYTGALGNSGEALVLKDGAGYTMDSVWYLPASGWPTAANGGGPSLELLNPDYDNTLPISWAASTAQYGTPGTQNSVYTTNGIITVTSPNGGENLLQGSTHNITWTSAYYTGNVLIQLFDVTLNSIIADLATVPVETLTYAWTVTQPAGTTYKIVISGDPGGTPTDLSNATFSITIPLNPAILVTSPNGGESWEQGSTQNITWTATDFTENVKIELNDGAKAITLLATDIPATAGTWSWTIPADQAVGSNYTIIVSDAVDGVPTDVSDAPFSIVALPSPAQIVITEIMYNPPETGNDSLEYIELYNAGLSAVNLAGWTFSLGVVFTFPDYSLNPGAYVIVSINSAAFLNLFGLPSLQWTSGALGNGGEPIELKSASGVVMDYVNYDDVAPWPLAADDFGPSLVLCDPSLDNSDGSNWTTAVEFVAKNAAGLAIYGNPGTSCSLNDAQRINIQGGWSGISSYVIPLNANVSDIFSPVSNDLVILQDFSSVYWPALNINTIGNMSTQKGYVIKTSRVAPAYTYLPVIGTTDTDKTIELAAGWNLLPVASLCNVDATTLFSAFPEIVIVKDVAGVNVWWPETSTYTLTTLTPGAAYYILVNSPISITFPACAK